MTGVVAGVVAGLLGVGGGIIIVPILEIALRFAGVPPEWRMHVAVATSLATIIPTSITSARAHHARGAVDWQIAKRWAAPMLLGALAGSLLASQARSALLTGVFGVAAVSIAAKMLLPLDHIRFADRAPVGVGGALLASAIGGVSALMGIGGGSLSVPTMTMSGTPIHRAVGTSAFLGLWIGIPGTIGYLLAKPDVALPWLTVGLVSVVGLLLIAPGAALAAPFGARIAHSLDKRMLSRAFGIFLLIVGARMLYRTIAS
jgi:uncharacterized membrane protein YfcA